MTIFAVPNGKWADALDPIVRWRIDLAFTRYPSLLSRLYNMQISVRAYEAVSGAGAISVDAWNAYKQSGVVGQADFDQMYKTTYTHIEYPIEIKIKRAAIADGDFANAFRLIDRVGDSGAQKREIDGAAVLNNAFTTTGADGVALCSDSHPNSPQKTGSTQKNNFALSLTRDNVRTVREAMIAFKDDNGQPIGIIPDTLLVPVGLGDDARVAVNSAQAPGGANNDINPQNGRFTVLEWNYLTDSNAWFMIDSRRMNQSLDWFDREPLSVTPKVEDKTIEATWIGYMRYVCGYSDWRWIAGSNPS